MAENFNDPFTDSQSAGEASPSNPNWTPLSTRELEFGGAIGNGYLYVSLETSSTLTYTFDTPVNISTSAFSFYDSYFVFTKHEKEDPTISVSVNGNQITSGTVNLPYMTEKATVQLSIPNPSGLENVTTLSFTFTNSTTDVDYYFGAISSVATCLAPESKVLTLSGYKELQDIQRGEELPQGRVARVIETFLSPNSTIEVVVIEKEKFLSGKLPLEDIFLCSNHILIHEGERKLAKELAASKLVRVRDVLLPAKDGKYKLLDIQFDFEGSYTVSGLTSQSRSPYCKISPLPKELYWNIENYKEIRVENTLYED